MPDNNIIDNLRNQIHEKISNGILFVVKAGINDEKSNVRINILRTKYKTLPNDHLAQILIKNAIRITTIEGFANGGGVSGCETVLAADPEPFGKIAAGAGSVALVLADATFTTKVQLQLIFDLATLYGCSYDKDDEEDVWQIFKAALGTKGTEKVVGYGRFIFEETAKKQFRKLLRTGIRKTLQNGLNKISTKQVAKLLAEKYLMRLIYLANMVIGAFLNFTVTKSVGKWAKTKAKVRTSTFKNINKLILLSRENAILSLPILFYVSTADDKLTDNEAVLYAQTEKCLSLTELEMNKVKKMVEDDDLAPSLKEELKNISNEEIKKRLFDIAITASAINLKERDSQHNCLIELSGIFGIPYERKMLTERIKDFKL